MSNRPKAVLRSLALEVTQRCNQQCLYCYNAFRGGREQQRELNGQQIRELMDRVLSQVSLKYVTLTGGEPFFHGDLFEIIEYLNGRGLGVTIISNGGLIDHRKAQRIGQFNIHYVQITLAGADDTHHDRHCGTGSFQRVTDAIEHLTAAGIKVGGSFLCTAQNFDSANRVIERFVSSGIEQIAFNRFNPSGFALPSVMSLLPTRSQILTALDLIHPLVERHGLRVTNTMPIPPCVLDKNDYPLIRFGNCSAATSQAEYAVGSDGCLRLCTLQKDALGSLYEESFEALLESPKIREFRASIPEFCRECPHAAHCLGGCSASAQWTLGALDELDPFVARHVMEDFEARLTQ